MLFHLFLISIPSCLYSVLVLIVAIAPVVLPSLSLQLYLHPWSYPSLVELLFLLNTTALVLYIYSSFLSPLVPRYIQLYVQHFCELVDRFLSDC